MVLAEEDRVTPESEYDAIPLLVVEVLSPSTSDRDRETKKGGYLRAGVAEVWLVDPTTQTIEVHREDESQVFAAGKVADSTVVPGFRVSYRELAG